jgi:hypothetical protein
MRHANNTQIESNPDDDKSTQFQIDERDSPIQPSRLLISDDDDDDERVRATLL